MTITIQDNEELRVKLSSIQDSVNNKIMCTTSTLISLRNIVPIGDKNQKLQAERLKNEFQTIVEKYSESQRYCLRKVKFLTNAFKMDDDRSDMERGQPEFQHELQVIKDSQLESQETKILDMNAIMRDLVVITERQGDAVDTLKTHIDNVQASVDQGTKQVVKASEIQTSYRKKVLILFVIALIVGLIVITKLNN